MKKSLRNKLEIFQTDKHSKHLVTWHRLWLLKSWVNVRSYFWGVYGHTHTHTKGPEQQSVVTTTCTFIINPPTPPLAPHLPLSSLLNSWGVKAKQGEEEEEMEEGANNGGRVVRMGGGGLWVTGQGSVPTNITEDGRAHTHTHTD